PRPIESGSIERHGRSGLDRLGNRCTGRLPFSLGWCGSSKSYAECRARALPEQPLCPNRPNSDGHKATASPVTSSSPSRSESGTTAGITTGAAHVERNFTHDCNDATAHREPADHQSANECSDTASLAQLHQCAGTKRNSVDAAAICSSQFSLDAGPAAVFASTSHC